MDGADLPLPQRDKCGAARSHAADSRDCFRVCCDMCWLLSARTNGATPARKLPSSGAGVIREVDSRLTARRGRARDCEGREEGGAGEDTSAFVHCLDPKIKLPVTGLVLVLSNRTEVAHRYR